MINVNTYNKENTALLREQILNESINEAENKIIDSLNSDVKIFEYQSTGKLEKALFSKGLKLNCTGLNKYGSFIDELKGNNSESFNYIFINSVQDVKEAYKADVIIALDALRYSINIDDTIKEILSFFGKDNYITVSISKQYGQSLNEIKTTDLVNGSIFANNIYSVEAVQELASKFELSLEIFFTPDSNEGVALLTKKFKEISLRDALSCITLDDGTKPEIVIIAKDTEEKPKSKKKEKNQED